MVAVYIKVDDETKVIDDIKFESYGCASNIATGSIITDMAKGKTLDEAKEISWKQASDELGGLPPIKAHCSVLAVEGLRAAIRDYEEKHGLIEAREPTTVEVIQKRLRHVMNPLRGLDIVRTDLVKDIQFEDGVVQIVVDLPRRSPVRRGHQGRHRREDRDPLGRREGGHRLRELSRERGRERPPLAQISASRSSSLSGSVIAGRQLDCRQSQAVAGPWSSGSRSCSKGTSVEVSGARPATTRSGRKPAKAALARSRESSAPGRPTMASSRRPLAPR